MHVFLEKAIEVLHHVVAEEGRNRTDLGGREYAEQQLRESESGFYLALDHCPVVFVKEDSLERPHLDAEFSCNGCQPQLHVAVRIKDEMMRCARRVLKKRAMDAFSRRRSQSAYLLNDLVFDSRQRSGWAA
jgi:hypothetical protein